MLEGMENKENTITLIIATEKGGGYDFYGQLIAKFMDKYLPDYSITVKNIPGEGHIVGCNEIYRSDPNNLTFGTFNGTLPLAQVAGLKGLHSDLSRMSWLGSAAVDPLVFVLSTRSPFKSLEDVMKSDQVVIASTGLGTLGHILPLLFAEMAGMKNVTIIDDYGGNELEQALIRGDVHCKLASYGSVNTLLQENHAIPIMYIDTEPVKGYEDVPLIQDVITDVKYKPLINLIFTTTILGRPFAGPPDIPEDKLQLLREAFFKALKDKALLEIAESAGRPVQYVCGAEVASLVKSILHLAPEIVNLIKRAYGVK